MHEVHVHIEDPTPRTWHAVDEVLSSLLGWKVLRVTSIEDFVRIEGPKLIYGRTLVSGAFQVVPCGWLQVPGMSAVDPPVGMIDDLPVLFPTEAGPLRFDLFAGAFFLLSRFEEWVGLPKDQHGRPITAALHAARYDYLQRPVVDEWVVRLATAWREQDPRMPLPQRTYKQVVTVDLDNGFKYLGRPLWRTVGSVARDVLKGRWAEVGERLRVLSGRIEDPFVIDDHVQRIFCDAADRTVFFVLAAPRGEMDHAVPVGERRYQRLLRSLIEWADIGLHPSYHSSDRQGLVAQELRSLNAAVGSQVIRSRQHFLRLRVPPTMRELEAHGIREEHSFGIHDRLGFRCGTCTPYSWYDLEQERVTDLVVHPFTVMDNTLRDKLRLDPTAAVEAVLPVIRAVKAVNGTFTGLWHESFLAATGPHKEWRSAILRIVQEARP